MLKKVIKRDGAKVDFEPSKVVNAVTAAMSRTDTGVDEDLVERIRLSISNSDKETLSVEEIQTTIKSFVDTATENGVTSIRNINYELSNMDEVYQEVLMMAIDNAKAKAEKISGGEVTIKSVKEEYVYSCTSLYRTYAENISQSLLGCIDIEARVSVEFE